MMNNSWSFKIILNPSERSFIVNSFHIQITLFPLEGHMHLKFSSYITENIVFEEKGL